jgi:hypothetical protein
MNKALEYVIAEAADLPDSAQESIARHALAEIEDYRAKVAAVEVARQEIDDGKGLDWADVKRDMLKRMDGED